MIRPPKLILCVAFIILAALLLFACTQTAVPPTPSRPPASGVKGTTLMEGGGGGFEKPPSAQAARPYAGVVTVHERGRTGRTVATVKADPSGVFKIDLPPGKYTLVGADAVPQTVTVEPGKYVTVTIVTSAL